MYKKLISICLGCVTFVFYLAIAEIGLQVYDLYLKHHYGRTNVEDFLFQYDPILGWKNKADASATYIVREDHVVSKVQINSKGLRGPEYDYPKPEGVSRILLLGDSIVAGFEVPEDKTVARILEHKLSESGEWQVLNGGVRGYATDQSYLFLLQEGQRYHPDIVIYLFVSNDIPDNLKIHRHGKKFGKSYFVINQDGSLELRGVPVPHFNPLSASHMSHPIAQQHFNSIENTGVLLSEKSNLSQSKSRLFYIKLKQFLYERSFLYKWITKQIKQIGPVRKWLFRNKLVAFDATPPLPKPFMDVGWEITKKIISKMKIFSDSIDANFAVLEVLAEAEGVTPYNELEGLTDQLGIPLIQSYDAFSQKSAVGISLRFKDHIHWNEAGHALGADLIHQFLVENKWIDL